MNFKHWIGVALVSFAVIAATSRIATLRKVAGY